ncbi:MAG TPA: DNA polymerase III subunit gamma/tau [Candidatus Acidoferrales bacterium]|nr:DNA polymerase III subunit gamma/tau [Candidatus Acidoferrales bacterium]
MSYLVLARKWRPQSFEDIAGQAHIARTLQNAIRTNRIAHAYLFTGVRGVGKTTAARILAKALNCEKGPTPNPCNQCSHCEEITNGTSLDVLEIDGASNRGIDEIRQIIENVRYHPAKCRFKIYIIDEVHQVTKDAFNALLKTLEEPPSFVKFILATTEPHRLPETILSRCQRYDFRRISLREIVQRLEEIAKKEGLNITEGALVLLAREADGSMRDAQSLLEQVLACAAPEGTKGAPSSVDEVLLQDILGLAERKVLYEISNAVIQGDAKRCIELVAEVVVQGCDVCRLSRDLVEHFRNLIVTRLAAGKTDQTGRQLLDIPDQEITDLSTQVASLSVEILLDYFDFMAAGDEEIARSANPRFALEATLVRLSTLPQTFPAGQLLERLEKLEQRLKGEAKPHVSPAKEMLAPIRVSPNVTRPVAPPSQAQTETLKAETVKIEASSNAGKDTVWQEFIAFIGKEKKFLASHLESCTALELPPGQLKIGVADRHHLNYLQDAEILAALGGLAKRFFSADVSLSVTAAPDGMAKTARREDGETSVPAAENSEMVKEALRIFGGSIRSVRREDR